MLQREMSELKTSTTSLDCITDTPKTRTHRKVQNSNRKQRHGRAAWFRAQATTQNDVMEKAQATYSGTGECPSASRGPPSLEIEPVGSSMVPGEREWPRPGERERERPLPGERERERRRPGDRERERFCWVDPGRRSSLASLELERARRRDRG
jgi:hypothetical protein